MIMKRWRVGSFSMGIILVALGVIMLVSLLTRIDILNIIITLWPVIMICLGVEILLHLFIQKGGDEDTKIKYDVLSILFIGFILIVSTFFYSVTFVMGTFGINEDMHEVFGIHSETAYLQSGTELAGAKELVVFNGVDSIKAIATTGENIRVDYSISLSSSDKEYAGTIINDIIEFENGERSYMLSNADMFYNNRKIGYPIVSCVIYMPPDKTLDLSQFYGRFEYDSVIEGQIIQP